MGGKSLFKKTERKSHRSMNCREINEDYVQVYGVCPECAELHWRTSSRRKLGRIDAYNLKWKQQKDRMRDKYHDDLLQPIGKDKERFTKLYGDPTERKNT